MVSVDGLVSGINTTDIINQLIALERRPITALQTRVADETEKQTAFLDLSARMLSLKTSTSVLANTKTFAATSVTSSNTNVLSATGSQVSALGSFVFTASSLAQTSQLVSQGFADSDTSAVGAGTLTIDTGPSGLARRTPLEQLNGGTGVDRGSIKITDRNGVTATIDLSGARHLQDVIDAINADNTINISAGITASGRSVSLGQADGATTTNITVTNVGTDTTATDLGIATTVAGPTLNGTAIIVLGSGMSANILNDGLGVSSVSGSDFRITQTDGTTIDVDLGTFSTVGDILTAINTQPDLVATLSGGSIVLTDTSGGGGTLSVAALNGSAAAADLGLTATAAAGVLTGDAILTDFAGVLLKNLNGGSGVSRVAGLDDFQVTLADGVTTFNVNLDGTHTALDAARLIATQAAAAGGSVSLLGNESGTGFSLVDNNGGSSNITVAALNGSTAAADMGLLGTGTGATLQGSNVNLKYISRSTRLDAMNGGKGVFGGKFKITDSLGTSSTVDLSQTDDDTIADVIDEINGAAVGVTASINANGDGLLLTDTAGGTGLLKVTEVSGGTTAKDLNILGTAATATTTIDGSFQYTITISATDTLEDVARAVNDLGIDAQGSIISTGSSTTPFRLSVLSKRAGKAGEIFVDGGSSAFSFTTTSAAEDAVLLFGATSGGSDPILLTSSDNTFRNVVPGLEVTIQSVSTAPVTITVARDTTQIADNLSRFVDTFNEIVTKIDELTDYNVDTEEAGLLLGNSTLSSIRRQLFSNITRPVSDVPSNLSLISQAGVRVQQNGSLTFDSSKFNSLLASNFDGIVDLFSKFKPITTTTKLTDLKNGLGVDIYKAGDDFKINLRDGTSFSVSLTGALDVQDALDAINNDTDNAGRIVAAVSTDKRSLILTDSTTGANPLSVTGLNGSLAFAGLGLNNPIANNGGVLTGAPLNAKGAPGFGKRLDELLTQFTDSINGTLKTAADGSEKRIKNLNDSIDDLEERVAAKEERLRADFTRMEVALSESQNTLSRLQSQLTSVLANSGK